jgi:hypothetical protein
MFKVSLSLVPIDRGFGIWLSFCKVVKRMPSAPSERTLTNTLPCPTCNALYGFHDDGPHREAQARIPSKSIVKKEKPTRSLGTLYPRGRQ